MAPDSQHADETSAFEDAGIPDLQDGSPEQQQASDPEEAPLPGEFPVGVDEWGTTVEEELEGEPLDGRLRRELPDPALTEIADDLTAGPDDDLDREPLDSYTDEDGNDLTGRPGRLSNDQTLEPGDLQVDSEADDVGADSGGASPEEQAMHFLEP
jgi:hypothetical protein